LEEQDAGRTAVGRTSEEVAAVVACSQLAVAGAVVDAIEEVVRYTFLVEHEA
jgi:hypothetical protein